MRKNERPDFYVTVQLPEGDDPVDPAFTEWVIEAKSPSHAPDEPLLDGAFVRELQELIAQDESLQALDRNLPPGHWVRVRRVSVLLPNGVGVLRLAVRVLPPCERAEWLEEQRGYLADLTSWRQRWAWVLSTLLGMPRYAYTVRTGTDKETA